MRLKGELISIPPDNDYMKDSLVVYIGQKSLVVLGTNKKWSMVYPNGAYSHQELIDRSLMEIGIKGLLDRIGVTDGEYLIVVDRELNYVGTNSGDFPFELKKMFVRRMVNDYWVVPIEPMGMISNEMKMRGSKLKGILMESMMKKVGVIFSADGSSSELFGKWEELKSINMVSDNWYGPKIWWSLGSLVMLILFLVGWFFWSRL